MIYLSNKVKVLISFLKTADFPEEADYLSGLISEDEILTPNKIDAHEEIEKKFFGSWTEKLDELAKRMDEFYFSPGVQSPIEYEPIVKELGFEWMGSGSFRIAVSSPGDKLFVAKVVHGRERRSAIAMNKSEAEKQQDFEGLFPKVYATADDYSWIVIEKVSPLKYKDGKLKEFFPWLSGILDRSDGWGDNIYDIFRFLLKAMGSEDKWNSYNGKSVLESQFNISKEKYKELSDMAINDPVFLKLTKAVSALNIDTDDLTEGNLGINSKGNLVILDSSIRDDFLW